MIKLLIKTTLVFILLSCETIPKKNISTIVENIVEKKKEMALLSRQKEISVINIQGKTLNQLTKDFGKPDLIREDGNTKSVRFNALGCRLFIYFDLEVKKPKAEYYEIRNIKGELIDKKEKINKCFKEIQKT